MVSVYDKIKTIDELRDITAQLKENNKRIVHCHGVFDLLHPGHIRHLSSAKKEGDILIVTVTADRFVKRGPGRPIFNEGLRAETLAALESVDYVCIDHNPTAETAIKSIRPDIYAKGREYEEKDITGKIFDEEDAVLSVGGRLAFTSDITFSSSKLINEHLDVFPPETQNYLKNISKKYPIPVIMDYLKSIKNLKVLVIGDAIIDQYHYCESMGKSLKEHLVVTKYLSEESFLGGVFATANNVAQVCGEVHLVSVLGQRDPHEDFILKHLQPNIKPKFFCRDNAQTTVKRRFVHIVTNQKLSQICYMNDNPLPEAQERLIAEYLEKIVPEYDLVIISDFGHGFINKILVECFHKNSKYLALNVQTNSANAGFNLVTKYPRSDYVVVDEPEIRLAAHDKHGNLKQIMEEIAQRLNCQTLMITLGPRGSISYDKKYGFHETPPFASKIVDVVGAGDALFAFTAPCVAVDMPQDLTAFIGNAVGALAVQIVCNRNPVNAVDLMKYIARLLK